MDVVSGVGELRERLDRSPRARAFVPTMGALHGGHLSLIRAARDGGATLVVSIFVNPLQFGPGEDLARYPRSLDGDLELLRAAGVDVVFTPDASELTPEERLTTVAVDRLTDVLEGVSRPGHFDGVTTIVAKLFNLVHPDRAYFGEKDFQQLVVIRRMVADLNVPVEVVGCPIVRDGDGLALSSRNAYLSATHRGQALALSRALMAARDEWVGDATATHSALRRTLLAAPGVRLDYAEVVDPETLEPLEGVVEGPARALVAALVGETRLIDNVRLEPRPR